MKLLLIEKFPPYNFYPFTKDIKILWNGFDNFFIADTIVHKMGMFIIVNSEKIRNDFDEEKIKELSVGVIKLKFPKISKLISFESYVSREEDKYIIGFFGQGDLKMINSNIIKTIRNLKKNINYVLTSNFIKSNRN